MDEGPSHRTEEFGVIEGLDEKGKCAGGLDRRSRGRIFVAGNENYPCLRRFGAEMREEFHARHPFHPDIEDGDLDWIIREVIQEKIGLAKGQHFKTIRLEEAPDRPAHRRIVINEADDLSRFRSRRRVGGKWLVQGSHNSPPPGRRWDTAVRAWC